VEASRYHVHRGRTSSPKWIIVEPGHIRRFAESIGDFDPIYTDEVTARQRGYQRIPAPPTFAIALRANDPREGLDLDWTKLLHAEQELIFTRPIFAGDKLSVVGRIADVYVKEGKSGPMDFMVLETTGTDEQEALVFTARSTIVIRR
jgi:acyl dehydratase